MPRGGVVKQAKGSGKRYLSVVFGYKENSNSKGTSRQYTCVARLNGKDYLISMDVTKEYTSKKTNNKIYYGKVIELAPEQDQKRGL